MRGIQCDFESSLILYFFLFFFYKCVHFVKILYLNWGRFDNEDEISALDLQTICVSTFACVYALQHNQSVRALLKLSGKLVLCMIRRVASFGSGDKRNLYTLFESAETVSKTKLCQ